MSSPSSTSQTLTSDARSSNLPSPLYWADRQPTRRHVRRDTSTSLSDLGRSLQPVVVALAAWGIETASSRSSSAACRRQIAPKNRRHKALKVTAEHTDHGPESVEKRVAKPACLSIPWAPFSSTVPDVTA